MSVWQKKATEKGNYEKPPEGTFPAACIGLVELGTHQDVYKGKATENHQIYIAFELLGEFDSEGKPFILARSFNSYFSKGTKFRDFIEKWRGKPFALNEDFDLLKLMTAKCLLTVAHEPSKSDPSASYAQINGISPPMKGMQVGDPMTTPFLWAFDMDTPFIDPGWLPYVFGQPVGDKIAESLEARGMVAKAPAKSPPPSTNGDHEAAGNGEDSPF